MESSPSPLRASPQWPWLAAAAVVPVFKPESLAGVGVPEHDAGSVLDMLVEAAEPIKAGPARGQWRLQDDMRRRVLAELGSPAKVVEAIRANAVADPTTRALLELCSSASPPTLLERSLSDLLALDQAIGWLVGAGMPPSVSREQVADRIRREKLFEPMRRLVVGFQGRAADLKALRAYTDTLPSESRGEQISRGLGRLQFLFRDHPPFMIHGPGGGGKSTLIARFILDHADTGPASRPMAFVLLDFDRSTLDPAEPDAMLAEIAAQLRVQFPDHGTALAGVSDRLSERIQTSETVQFEKSAHYSKSDEARAALAMVMNDIAKNTGQNILFVVDTFEIVQRRGPTAVYSMLDFIGRFLSDVRRLRVVLVGRAELQRSQFQFANDLIQWQDWPLKGFDETAGRAYLRTQLTRFPALEVSDQTLDRLVLLVRGNPLGLRLVAQVFGKEGAKAVEEVLGDAKLDEKVAEEQIQGMLHARIIEHLGNEELRKLADPGLIVRRITEPVIEQVLAGPCDLDLTKTSAKDLFELLKQEFSLIEVVDDATVRHKPDVRLIMLPSLRAKLGPRARGIDEAAIAFWRQEPGLDARAEELYHRLWHADPRPDLDPLWVPDLREPMEDVWEEFRTAPVGDWPRIWLSEKLGRELPDEIRARADQVVWESDVELKVRGLLSDGKPEVALSVMGERARTAWTPLSVLWILQIEALLLRGNADEALKVIDQAESRLPPAGGKIQAVQLMARRVSALERLQRWDAAERAADQALVLARAAKDNRSVFSCGVTRCRLADRGERSHDLEIVALRKEVAALVGDPDVRQALADSPVLHREAVAALGAEAPNLLADALDRFGWGSSDNPRLNKLMAQLAGRATRKRKQTEEFRGAEVPAFESLAGMIRDGKVKAPMLEQLAGIYSTLSDQLARQVLKS